MFELISYESRHSTDYTNLSLTNDYQLIVQYNVLYVLLSSCHGLLGLHVYGSREWFFCTTFISILHSFIDYHSTLKLSYQSLYITLLIYLTDYFILVLLSLLTYHANTFIYTSKSPCNRL